VSAKPTVLLAAPIGAPLHERLEARYELIGPTPPPFESSIDSLPPEVLQRARAVVSIGVVKIGAATLAKLPSVGLITFFGSGYEGLDLAAARERGIVLACSVGTNAASVADLAIALMLEAVREIPRARARLYAGEWKGNDRARPDPPRGLTGRRLGIYGLGAIGQKIALRGLAMEMQIAYHNRRRRADVPYPYMASLVDLARWADVLMIAARAGPSNHHAVDRGVLMALGKDGFVVNVARGSVIDEDVLTDCLTRGEIAGAGLDVFEREPDVSPALLGLPNVALTPHVGGLTIEAREAMEDMVAANIDAYFAGRPVPTPVPE